jgi:peptidoglycan/xylan/chitin deacetylase (PgdA/CDA1 family)
VTFDDGWRDFYDFAFPILRKYQVPATVFLPTGFIGSNCTFWTDRLAQLLKKIESSSTGKAVGSNRSEDPLVHRILCNQSNLPEWIEYSINLLKGEIEERIEKVLCELALLAGGFSRSERRFLTWKEVREAQASDLIDFGSHTVRHQILTHLDSGVIQTELKESRQKLIQEKAVHSEFIPFCYPNGNYSVKIKELVQDAGYSTACTTRYGINFPQGDRFALKRVGIHQDMSAHEGLLGCRLLGIC